MELVLRGHPLVPGTASGLVLAASEPLSFWGGYDPRSGEIIDRRHALAGQVASGKILALPLTRGSSTTTAILLEAIRAGTAPAAIIITGIDAFVALASIVADELLGKPIPIVALTHHDFATLATDDVVAIDRDGTTTVHRAAPS